MKLALEAERARIAEVEREARERISLFEGKTAALLEEKNGFLTRFHQLESSVKDLEDQLAKERESAALF